MAPPSSAADPPAPLGQQERPFGLLLVALLLLAHSFFHFWKIVALPFSLHGPWGVALLEFSVLKPFVVAAVVALLGAAAAGGLWHRKRWGCWLLLVWDLALLFHAARNSLALASVSSRSYHWMIWGPFGFVVAVLVVFLVVTWRGTGRAWVPSRDQSRSWAGQLALLILVGFGCVAYATYRNSPPRTFEIAGKPFPIPPGCSLEKDVLVCPYSSLSSMLTPPSALTLHLEQEIDQTRRFGGLAKAERFWVGGREVEGYRYWRYAAKAQEVPPRFLIPASFENMGALLRCGSCLPGTELPQACDVVADSEEEVRQGPDSGSADSGATSPTGHLVPRTSIRSILALTELRPWCGRTSTSPLAAGAARKLAQKQAEEWDPAAALILVEELTGLGGSRSARWKLLFKDRPARRLLAVVISAYGIEDVAETNAPTETLARWPAISEWSVDPRRLQRTGVHELLVDPESSRRRQLVGTTLESPTAVWFEEQGDVFDAATGASVAGALATEVLEEIRGRPPLG